MSTNYYLRNKSEYANHCAIMEQRNKIIDDIIKQVEEWTDNDSELYSIRFKLEDAAYAGYEEIHIGKRSAGWKPLFQKQLQFSSVRGLKKFYNDNRDTYEIVNEYKEVLTWNELKTELIDWKGGKENDMNDVYKDVDGYTWANYEFC